MFNLKDFISECKAKDSYFMTKEEEIGVLEYLIENPNDFEFLGRGSSRAVFSFRNDNSVVFKIAPAKSGVLQNDIEYDLFLEYGSIHLARIYAAGTHILISEFVKIPSENEWDDDFYEVKDWGDVVLGYSSDNEQIGYRIFDDEREYVLYDYGYLPAGRDDVRSSEFVGNLYNVPFGKDAAKICSFILEAFLEDKTPTNHSFYLFFESEILDYDAYEDRSGRDLDVGCFEYSTDENCSYNDTNRSADF